MTELLYRTQAGERREIDKDNRTISFVASTNEKDRYGTVIVQDWELKNFNRNPVFLWSHMSRVPAIGRVTQWTTGEAQSTALVRFGRTEAASEVFDLYVDEILNAVSVGFDFEDYEFIKDVVVLRGNELYELSAVNVPGNASALVEGRANGKLEALSRAIRTIAEPELGRKIDNQDLDLLVAGARFEELEKLRSIDALEARIAELERQLRAKETPPQPKPQPAEDTVWITL